MAGDGTVVMEGVRLVFRNFTGKEGKYNREGDRGFGVIIPDEATAEAMEKDGWNVKRLNPSQEEQEAGVEQGPPYLSVKVGYGKGRPPKIVLVTQEGKKRTPLNAETIEMLDWADITNVDVIVRPYNYDVSGRQGISAYVQTMFVSINEDPLEAKYSAMDDDDPEE